MCGCSETKQPFLDWLNGIERTVETTLEELQRDCHVYLVPDFEEEDIIEKVIEKYLKRNYTDIFINELSGWYTDERMFAKLNYPLFLEWFDISMNTMIFDTVDLPLDKDD